MSEKNKAFIRLLTREEKEDLTIWAEYVEGINFYYTNTHYEGVKCENYCFCKDFANNEFGEFYCLSCNEKVNIPSIYSTFILSLRKSPFINNFVELEKATTVYANRVDY